MPEGHQDCCSWWWVTLCDGDTGEPVVLRLISAPQAEGWVALAFATTRAVEETFGSTATPEIQALTIARRIVRR
jgi:hypothetical protein